MSAPLQRAFAALMEKAPGAAFQKARALYLNKYSLPQENNAFQLRLFVCDEQISESITSAADGHPTHRVATLSSCPGQLALVHWQQPCPPSPEQLTAYLKEVWELDAAEQNITPMATPWFRDSGHQSRFSPPCELIWQQRSLLTLQE